MISATLRWAPVTLEQSENTIFAPANTSTADSLIRRRPAKSEPRPEPDVRLSLDGAARDR